MHKMLQCILLSTLLSACAGPPSNVGLIDESQSTTQHDPNVCDAIQYYAQALQWDAIQKRREFDQLRVHLASQQYQCGQLYLAILLSEPKSVLQDDDTALIMINAVTNDEVSLSNKDMLLAKLLKQFVNERISMRITQAQYKQRLDNELQRNQQSKRELTKSKLQLEQLKKLESAISHQEQRIAEPSIEQSNEQ